MAQEEETGDRVRPQFGNRYLRNEAEVFRHNAWDDVEWDAEQLQAAQKQVAANSEQKIASDKRQQLEADAGKHWDDFYQIHNNRFFKDRNWLFTEFPELLKAAEDDKETFQVLEIGCGVGNTVYPILERIKNPLLKVFCCDFSATAVSLVKSHVDFEPKRCTPFVLDLTSPVEVWASSGGPFQCLREEAVEGSLDVILAIFVLSALEPTTMKAVAARLAKSLRPGGILLFRDYGQYDLAQLRFKSGKCLDENFYLRGDGTRCYFFSQEGVRRLFGPEGAGLVEEQNKVDRRLQVNRGKQLKMYRVWIQAKYRKALK